MALSMNVRAQYYSATEDVERLMSSDSSALHLTIDNYNFLWNNEFFGPVVKGYTLIGYNLQPALEYHFTTSIKAKAGIRLTKYSGLDKFSDCVPVYSVTWHTDNLAVTMGTIDGASFHRMPDPIMDRERQLVNNYENGMQIVYNTDRLFADVWVDWQDFIFFGDNKKEKIFGGFSLDWNALESSRVKLDLPASMCIYHMGGQIDTDDSTHMKLLYNMSAGLRLSVKGDGFVDCMSAESQVLGFMDNSPTPESLYNDGWGVLSELKLGHGKSYVSAGYWYADKFLSTQGNKMYQCQSVNPEDNQLKRNMLTCEMNIAKDFTDYFTMGLWARGYFDIDNSVFDYTYSFLMVLRPDFAVWRRK